MCVLEYSQWSFSSLMLEHREDKITETPQNTETKVLSQKLLLLMSGNVFVWQYLKLVAII